jgi:hypothetical protein
MNNNRSNIWELCAVANNFVTVETWSEVDVFTIGILRSHSMCIGIKDCEVPTE